MVVLLQQTRASSSSFSPLPLLKLGNVCLLVVVLLTSPPLLVNGFSPKEILTSPRSRPGHVQQLGRFPLEDDAKRRRSYNRDTAVTDRIWHTTPSTSTMRRGRTTSTLFSTVPTSPHLPFSLISPTDDWGNWLVLIFNTVLGYYFCRTTKLGKLLGPPMSAMFWTFFMATVGILPSGGSPAATQLQTVMLYLATPLVLLSVANDFRQTSSSSHEIAEPEQQQRSGQRNYDGENNGALTARQRMRRWFRFRRQGGASPAVPSSSSSSQPLYTSFLLASLATLLASVAGWFVLKPALVSALGGSDALKIAAALLARNVGGGLNYIAVCTTLQASPTAITAGMCVDNIVGLCYFPVSSYLAMGHQDPAEVEAKEAQALLDQTVKQQENMTVKVELLDKEKISSSQLITTSNALNKEINNRNKTKPPRRNNLIMNMMSNSTISGPIPTSVVDTAVMEREMQSSIPKEQVLKIKNARKKRFRIVQNSATIHEKIKKATGVDFDHPSTELNKRDHTANGHTQHQSHIHSHNHDFHHVVNGSAVQLLDKHSMKSGKYNNKSPFVAHHEQSLNNHHDGNSLDNTLPTSASTLTINQTSSPTGSKSDDSAVSVENIMCVLTTAMTIIWLSQKIGGMKASLPVSTVLSVLLIKILTLNPRLRGNAKEEDTVPSFLQGIRPSRWLPATNRWIGSIQPTAQVMATVTLHIFFSTLGAQGGRAVATLSSSMIPLFAFELMLYLLHGTWLWALHKSFPHKRCMSVPRLLMASSAAIGGPATAVALAQANSWKSLQVPGLLAGNVGDMVGTFLGIGFFALFSFTIAPGTGSPISILPM